MIRRSALEAVFNVPPPHGTSVPDDTRSAGRWWSCERLPRR
jgi:hypothetical protein